MAIIKIKNPAIDLDAAEIPNLPASKITSGTLDNARISLDAAEIPNLDTAKITTGTLADARIPANALNSNVDLTNLSASNLTSGTLPDARFPATLPAVSGASLTNLPGGGKILQVIQDEYPTEQTSTSTSFVDIGGLSVTITPSSTSSKIFAMATLTSCRGATTSDATHCNVFFRLVRGSTELTHSRLNFYDGANNSAKEIDGTIALSYLDSPNSTSAQTYKCQMKALSNKAVKVNVADSSNSAMSTITVFEVGA